MFLSLLLVTSAIKGDRISVLRRTHSFHRGLFWDLLGGAGWPPEPEPSQFIDCFSWHWTLWRSQWTLLWWERMFPKCPIPLAASWSAVSRTFQAALSPAPSVHHPRALPPGGHQHRARAGAASPYGVSPRMGDVQGPLSPGERGERGAVGETTSSRPPPWGNAGKTAASNFEFQNLKLFALATRIDQIPFVSLLHCLQG